MRELLDRGERSFSFEFFPPRDEAGEEQLWDAIRALEPYRPTFVSVTYGAGGTTRDKTVGITGRIARDTSLTPVAHLTCVGHTRAELEKILDTYAAEGVEHVMLLRGDPSDGPRAEWTPTDGGLTYAVELVELARSRGDFRIGVAAFPEGHPSASSRDADADVLVAKAEAGAEFAVTQMFFRASDYFELVERVRARGVDIPILPGIMPILNLNAIRRQGELIGTDVPADLVERISRPRRRPRRDARRGHRDRRRALRGAARRRRAGAALLHAEPLQGDAGDLRRAQHDGLTTATGYRREVRTLTVTGTGSAAAVPDTALVRLSAVHRARTLTEALSGAESAREAVVTAAGDLVVSTVNLSVWPINEQGEIPGFEARHSLTIATGDLATANELLSDLAYAVGGRLVVDGRRARHPGPLGRDRAGAGGRVRRRAVQGGPPRGARPGDPGPGRGRLRGRLRAADVRRVRGDGQGRRRPPAR